jgi:hypothetical protein
MPTESSAAFAERAFRLLSSAVHQLSLEMHSMTAPSLKRSAND